jgi:ABC-type spermidine/putrescine transport system permease subunit I
VAAAFFVEPESFAEIVVAVVCLLLGVLLAALYEPACRWRALQFFILFSCVATAIALLIAASGFFAFLEMKGLCNSLYELLERTRGVCISGVAGMLSVYLYRLVV